MRSIEKAGEHLGIAATMYHDMCMTEWVQRTNGELGALA
jgi:hypothetical protein